MSDDPSKTLPAVDAMRQDWAIVDALMGGTKAMRVSVTELQTFLNNAVAELAK
ncbi:hypothetical protein GV729_09340 [Pseudomonas sp. Fl4BN2]|nr:hypothetical protein [Pseudomonas sp. Fl4BN2]